MGVLASAWLAPVSGALRIIVEVACRGGIGFDLA